MPRATKPSTAGASNTSLHAAKQAKNDEFYTQLTDIEKELRHYKNHFKGKVVFCNCDDPEWSNFWKFFTLNFEHFGLAKVVATHYAQGEPSYKLECFGADTPPVKTPLTGDGDFRSAECVAILKTADIVVTNPPFSLFREYVAQLVEHEKQFLIIGNNNAITYKEVFKQVKSNQLWLGISPRSMKFRQADGSLKDVNACWFTNLPHKKRNEELVLFKTYAGNEDAYPRYDNYGAIEVSKVCDIPVDYAGVIGVPITFLDKYNPEQFEIVGTTESNDPANAFRTRIYSSQECRDAYFARFGQPGVYDLNASGVVAGVKVFKRVLIRIAGTEK
jgi:hypothetical protein